MPDQIEQDKIKQDLLDNLNRQSGLPGTQHEDDASSDFMKRREDSEFSSIEEKLLSKAAPAKPETAAPGKKPADSPGVTAGGVAKDVGEGFIEMPLQIAGGVVDAFNETMDITHELGQWMTDNVADLGQITFDENGIGFSSGAPKENMLQAPTTDEADSVTGGVIRNISKFITGFFGAGKLKPLKMMKPTTNAGKVGKAMVQGAVADATVFDPHEERLSNLIGSVPELKNPITDYLAADPNDSAAEGRFKNAVEGLGIGVAFEGLLKGLKVMRSMRKAKSASNVAAESAGLKPELQPIDVKKDLEILGDLDNTDLFLKKTKEKLKEVTGKTPKDVLGEPTHKIEINFARIDSPDDIKKVIQKMADDFSPEINKARRGKVSFEQTKLNAEQKNAWDILVNRRKGQPLGDSDSVAVRNLWVSSGTKLKEMANLAVNTPSKTNLYAFRKMLATHNAIQKEVISARTETARALNSWKIPASGNATMLSHIDELLETNGTSDIALDLAKRVKALAEMGDESKLSKFVEQGWFAKSRQAVLQVWINSMLSSPATHVVNAMSNWSVAGMQIIERKGAAYLGRVLGHEDTVQMGEATAQVFGLVEGIKDAMKISSKGKVALKAAGRHLAEGNLSSAKKALKESEEEFGGVFRSLGTGESGFGLNKIETPNVGALSSEAWNISSDTWVGRGMDLIDGITKTPGRALAVGDEFFKSMGYRMELHAQALRQASKEVQSGALDPSNVKKRIAEIIDNPPESIRLEAADAATYQTFTRNTEWLPNKIAKSIQQIPVLGRILLPFRRTPVNILSFAMERTPLAPLVKEFRADIMKGGAHRDIALARMATGSMLLLAAADMRMNGTITGGGPSEPGERQLQSRMGVQPYSVNIGGRQWSFSRADPIGMTLGIAADAVDIITNSMEDDTEIEAALVATTLSIAKNVTSKTYMKGLSQFFDALSDPDRYGNAYFQSLAGSLIPAGVSAYARVEDPNLKIAGNMWDKIKSRTPWWNQDLPDYHDIWGRPVTYESGLGKPYDFISPFYSRTKNPEKIDTELERLGYFPRLPRADMSFNGVTVNMKQHPAAYQRLIQLAGNDLKIPAWNMGTKDYLNEVVSGKHEMSQIYNIYSDGPDGGKAQFIEKVINDSREMAKKKVMEEYPEIKAEVTNGQLMFKKLNPEILGIQ